MGFDDWTLQVIIMDKDINIEVFDRLRDIVMDNGMQSILDALPWFFKCSIEPDDWNTVEHL